MSSSGAVELWHPRCWTERDLPVPSRDADELAVVAPVSPPPRRGHGSLLGAGVVATVVLVGIGSYMLRVPLPAASLATINFDTQESLVLGARMSEREMPPREVELRDEYPVPELHGQPLDELYPSLLDWIHPVADTEHVLPPSRGGRFGAERGHVVREDCGRGHCGVDLGGPIGRPIVAVADGIVVRVERSELGRDGRSGRYVRIEHADGTLTAYMHLDEVIEGLEVGDRVDGGQQIGTLGATAIFTSAPHLHFSLELPKVPGTHGDHVNTIYVDPAPFLARASIAKAPDRRHPIKPAF